MRVKFIILSIIIGDIVGSCGLRNIQAKVHQQQGTLYTFQDVQNVLDKQIEQWNLGNIDGFMEGYWNSDSMLFVTAKGPRYGFNAVSDSYKINYPSKEAMGNLRFEIIKIQWVDKESGVSQVLGKWYVAENSKPQTGYFSLIFKYINQQPRIVIDHTW